MGIVVELIKGKVDNVRGAIVRVPKSNSLITRPICKLYHIESLRECSDERVTVNDNTIKERPKREAAILGNIKWKFTNWRTILVGECVNSSKSFIEETKFYKKDWVRVFCTTCICYFYHL